MCGIVGYISKKQWDLDKGISSITHRGPDFQNKTVNEVADKKVGLGHARLSIIDLNNSANQPLSIENENYTIIYNGEIYNYRELKKKLEQKGINFNTDSDTEVLLQYYKQFGIHGLVDLEGMFAFAILDKQKKELILARDQLGIKPLYYWQKDNSFFWSSELKGLWNLVESKAKIDTDTFEEYLATGFIYEPDTGFEEVYKLPPGSYLKISLSEPINEKVDPKKFWVLTKTNKVRVKEIEDEVRNTIKSHLVSDVPLGLFYSGGVDSSLILTEVKQEIKSFIVKSDSKEYEIAGFTNDFEYGKIIADILEADLEIISLNDEINNENFLDNISELARLSEEPIADFTFQSSMLLSSKAKESGYKVMLSGMGADEIFAGYPRYQLIKYGQWFSWLIPIFKPLFQFSNFLRKKIERFENYYKSKGFLKKYTTLLTPFSRDEIGYLLIEKPDFRKFDQKLTKIVNECPFESSLKKAMYLDLFGFLSHNFLVADKSSMQSGLELRVPLATHKLAEMTFNLPDKKLLGLKKAKIILKKMLYKVLPKKLVDRRKAGFHPPLDTKIKNLGPNRIKDFLEKNGLFEIISREALEEILKNHFEGNINNTFKIYRLMYLSAWYNENK